MLSPGGVGRGSWYPICPCPVEPQHIKHGLDAESWRRQLPCSMPPSMRCIPSTVKPEPISTDGRKSPIVFRESPRLVVSPTPSCPLAPRPQHFTAPVVEIAHDDCQPQSNSLITKPVPRLTPGRLSPISLTASPLLSVSSYPNVPYSLFPQHLRTFPVDSAQQKLSAPQSRLSMINPVPRSR